MLPNFRTVWSFRRSPGRAIFVVATLAIAIGAATAVFSLVDTALLRELPFREADRLVWMWNARVERDRAPFSVLDFEDYRSQTRALAGVASFTNWTANLTGVGEAERLEGVRVAPEFFDVLGADAAFGRVFHSNDDPLERLVVITDGLWRRLGADTSWVGRPLDLSGVRYTVIGILPRGFVFPFRSAELAVPLAVATDPRRAQRGFGFLRAIARLRPRVTVAAAKQDLDAIGRRLQAQYPADDAKKTGVNLYPLKQEIVGDASRLLVTLLAAVTLVLFIAAVNASNLLMLALATRKTELEIRAALGASRRRLIGQISAEAGLLVALGGVAGVWLATVMVRALVSWIGAALPRVADAHLDASGVAFALCATLSAAVMCAIVPAVHATVSLEPIADDRRATLPPGHQRLRRALVAAQMALALVLLVAIGLTLRSFVNLQRVEPGFRPSGTLSIQLSLPPNRYGSAAAINQLADALRSRLAMLPAVASSAAISLLPLSGLLRAEDFRIVGRPDPSPDAVPQAHYRVVTPGYFGAMGIRLLGGREFTDDDRAGMAPVAIISRQFGERFWPGVSPIGAHLRVGNARAPVEIVGIVVDVKQFTLDAAATADLYVPLQQAPDSEAPLIASRMYWVIATAGDPANLVEAARAEIHALDGEIATSSARTLARVLDDALGPRRFNLTVMAIFAQVALLLAAAGVYAVAAFAVQQRTREIGVRMALGARPRDVIVLVLVSEWRAVTVGAVVGAAGGIAGARLLSSTLFQVSGVDAGTLAGALAVLLAGAASGCYLPARRAAAVEPVEALR